MYEINLAKRLSHACVHLVTDRASLLTIECRVHQFAKNTSILGHFVGILLTMLHLIQSKDIRQSLSTHFLSISFHVVRPHDRRCVSFSHLEHFSVALAEIRDSNIFLHSSINDDFVRLASTSIASQENVVEKCSWFVKINILHRFLPHGSHILSLSSHFSVMCVHRHELSLFSMNKQAFTFRHFFPIQVLLKLRRTVFPIIIQHVDVRKKNRPRGTTGSSIFDHDLGHLCGGRGIHTSEHSDVGISSNLLSVLHFHLCVT